MAGGRPSGYSDELGATICERIAGGESVRGICGDDAMPTQSMLFRWLANNKGFREQYAHAREAQMEAMAEEILEIADDTSGDTKVVERESGSVDVCNSEWISRSKLRVDSRKWLMSKLAPKKYGEKVEQFISGPSGGPIQSAITVEFVKTGEPNAGS